MEKSLAPILLFTYKRLDTLMQTVEALRKNLYAEESELFIFSDGPKTEADKEKVEQVRAYLREVTGFKSIRIFASKENKGLAKSIIEGVTEIINKYEKVIVLEDDLITSSNFLTYMNQALDYYYHNSKIFSISGFTLPVRGLNKSEVYFTMRASSWGWATWKDQWNVVDWEVKDFNTFIKNTQVQKNFNAMGSDMTGMLIKQMEGKINSWAIRWCYHQFRHDLYTVYPSTSKILNIGFGNSATHTTARFNRFKTVLDDSGNTVFNFSSNVAPNKNIIKQIVWKYSVPVRVFYKVINSLVK